MSPEARRFYCRGGNRNIASAVRCELLRCPDSVCVRGLPVCKELWEGGGLIKVRSRVIRAGISQSRIMHSSCHFFFFFRFVKKQENVMGGRFSSDAA